MLPAIELSEVQMSTDKLYEGLTACHGGLCNNKNKGGGAILFTLLSQILYLTAQYKTLNTFFYPSYVPKGTESSQGFNVGRQ